MFKSILVPTDGSYLSELALGKAIEFAKINPGAKIVALSVAEPVPSIAGEAEVWASEAEKFLSYASNASQSFAEKVADAAKKAGIPCETVLKTSVRPWQEIVATAKEKNCDCIVMASHGRKGYNALVLGSNANKVLTHSHIPVLVFRPALVPDISAAEGAQWDMMGF